jgi:uncharacterized protein YjeT (DUF2065 family)
MKQNNNDQYNYLNPIDIQSYPQLWSQMIQQQQQQQSYPQLWIQMIQQQQQQQTYEGIPFGDNFTALANVMNDVKVRG